MQTKFVDFRVIKEQVSIRDVLAHYNIELRQVNKNSLRGACPLPTHNSKTSDQSFGVDITKNIWACQSNSCVANRSGKKGGNVLDFVAVMESCSIRDAALKLHEWFSISESATPARKEHEQGSGESAKTDFEKKDRSDTQATRVNEPLAFTLKGIDPSHAYLRQRGIKEETAKTFGVGFFPGRGSMSGRVVIPIHNKHAELVGYAGRSLDGSDPKYKLPAGFVKSAVLFNLHRIESECVIIVEGFFDCLKVWQSGSRNVVALMGSSLSDQQSKLLARFKKIIFVAGW